MELRREHHLSPFLSAPPRRFALASLPTPVEPAPWIGGDGVQVFVKREDRTSPIYGGGKVRKLEWLLANPPYDDGRPIVSIGGIGSHHLLAVALFLREQGRTLHAWCFDQVPTRHTLQDLAALVSVGGQLWPVKTRLRLPLAALAYYTWARPAQRGVYMPPGGTTGLGCLGFVEAGLELAQQLVTDLPGKDPAAIYVALGSGGTAVGLSLGLAAAGVMIPVVAVRVTPRALLPRALLSALAHQVVEDLRAIDDRFPQIASLAMENLIIDEDELGEGYAVPTLAASDALRLARNEAGLELDGTYTAKTFAALVKAARGPHKGKRLVYVHTLSSAPMGPLLDGAPPLPAPLARLLK